jgi:hypothetical protein
MEPKRLEERRLVIGKLVQRIGHRDTSFTHEPLKADNDTRILELDPGQKQEPLKGSLQQVSISSPSHYHALSYTWGQKEAAPHIIWIDGVECCVRHNLWEALKALRHPTTIITIWVDAICIDQENASERTIQVRMMDQIYRQAQCVHVWLGQYQSEDEKALMCMQNPDSGIDGSSRTPQFITTGCLKAALTSLMRRRYWRRAWIAQEFILANKMFIHCGDGAITWSSFERSYYTFQSDLAEKADHAVHLIEQRRLYHSTLVQQTESLEALLFKHADKECEDGRDRIFALLSFAHGCQDGEGVRPDYTICGLELLFRILHFCKSANSARLASLLCQSLDLNGGMHGKIEQHTCGHRGSQSNALTSALWRPTLETCWSQTTEFLGGLSNQSSVGPMREECYHRQIRSWARNPEKLQKHLRDDCQPSYDDEQELKLVFRLTATDLVVIASSSLLHDHLQSDNQNFSAVVEVGFLRLSVHPSMCCIDRSLKLLVEFEMETDQRDLIVVQLSCADLAQICTRYRQRKSGIHNADESFACLGHVPSELYCPDGSLPYLRLW